MNSFQTCIERFEFLSQIHLQLQWGQELQHDRDVCLKYSRLQKY